MAAINRKRVLLGTVAGWLVWAMWSMVVNAVLLAPYYEAAGDAGHLLKEPRYAAPVFLASWFLTLLIVTGIAAHVYAWVRGTLGPGPGTALRVGILVGFCAGFPLSLSVATWVPVERIIPLWWMLDLWVGAILATFVAAWLYKD
ncbi:MAG: hypothetical protein HY656_06040 [Acidobacteria bacterium]|nr:hypothetical protein [Acidobacteriota bacterium]